MAVSCVSATVIESLTNPFDLCLLGGSSGHLLAIADDSAGVRLIDVHRQQVVQTLKDCCDACSVSQGGQGKQLLVSCSRQPTSDRIDLLFYDTRSPQHFTDSLSMPSQPQVKGDGNVRWLASDGQQAVYVCAGDNSTGALWALDPRNNRQWLTLATNDSTIEHVCVRADGSCLLAAEYNSSVDSWQITSFQLDQQRSQVTQRRPIIKGSQLMPEPWSVACDPVSDDVYIYDYQAGSIWHLQASAEQRRELIGKVGGGQWVSIDASATHTCQLIFISCSDERCVKTFRTLDMPP